MTASIKDELEPVLSFLDGLAENAEPGARHPLNSIIIGKGAKVCSGQLRTALASIRADEREEHGALTSAGLDRALTALSEISESHIPDCPSHYAGDELAWAQRHVATLRRKASIARDAIAAVIRAGRGEQ